jgi:hypothetical protein
MNDLERVQDLLSDALQSDLENGVKWLNEMASEEFAKKYPALVEAINTIMRMGDAEQEQTSANRRGSPAH